MEKVLDAQLQKLLRARYHTLIGKDFHYRHITLLRMSPIIFRDCPLLERWETDEAVPRPTQQRKLCEALGVTPDELLAAIEETVVGSKITA